MKPTDKEIKEQLRWYNADMYLPRSMMWLCLVLLCPGLFFMVGIFFAATELSHYFYIIVPLILVISGVALPICIKNQMLVMLSEQYFAYRTMFGNIYVYQFSEIKRIIQMPDSQKLYMYNGKTVHMEKCAVKSPRLLSRLAEREEAIRRERVAAIKENIEK